LELLDNDTGLKAEVMRRRSGLRTMGGNVFHHMSFLSKGSGADLTDEGLLPCVDLEVLLEVEPLGVDEEAAHGAALVIRPMVIHVDVEVVKVGEDCGALDAVQRPQVVLDLVLVLADGGVVVGAGLRLVRGDRALHRHRRRLRQVLQRQFGLVCLLKSGNQDGRHLLLLQEG